MTQKELQRQHERELKDNAFVNDASSLKEYELEEIISHYKESNKGYRYIVRWKDPTIPNSDIELRHRTQTSAADLSVQLVYYWIIGTIFPETRNQ